MTMHGVPVDVASPIETAPEAPGDDEDPVPQGEAPSLRTLDPVRVVGIGASAGGLEALRVLVRGLPAGRGACYAVAQHLSPSHRSMLVSLLAREATLPVVEIADGMAPQADVIYVTPATCHVRVQGGVFRLEAATQPGTPKPSVDAFFDSLATAFEGRAIGVVLSGTGSDGARGMRAIHAAGGCTLAQEPMEAKYDGMPRAAIESGGVDFIVPVAEIAGQLERMLELGSGEGAALGDGQGLPVIEQIVSTVKRGVGFDLSLYKPRSLERRIRRRVVATGSNSMEAYAELLQHSPQEVDRVIREMFISVTHFFRDPEAFEGLRRELARLLEARSELDELRVWAPGCATGEEAYSLAMLIADQLDRMQRSPTVRLFATDLDTAALTKARRGVFPIAALAEVPEAFAHKFLSVSAEQCQVVKRVRDMVIFSEHNLLHDPAFLRLDLISCRNLLIYLQPDVQQRVLTTFAQALKPSGLLFLGRAESLYAHADLFQVVDGGSHLYRSRGQLGWQGRPRQRLPSPATRQPAPRAAGTTGDVGAWLSHAHADGMLAPFVLMDDSGRLLHVFGDVSPYLRLGAGLASLEVLQLAIEPIRIELRSILLHALHQSHKRVSTEVVLDGGSRRLQLVAMRREEVGMPAMTLVLFEERVVSQAGATDDPDDLGPSGALKTMEGQLTATRDHLGTVINELESANEELQSLNEEMQSTNEELQSANEELETANEELQSTNEELITVNEELESRTAELSLLNADLQNVKNSLADPIIVVDEHRRVTLHNPPAEQIFAIDATSVGSLLFSLPCRIDVGDASSMVTQVIQDGTIAQCQLVGERCYQLRVQPYRDASGERKGAVLTFHDNTELLGGAQALKAAHAEIAAAERFARATIDALPQQIAVIDPAARLVSVNARWRQAAAACQVTTRGCLQGSNLLEALERDVRRGDVLAERLAQGLREVLSGGRSTFEIDHPCGTDPEARHFRTTVTGFGEEAGSRHWVVAHEDVTERKGMEAQMRLKAMALNSSASAVSIADMRRPDMPLVYVNEAFEHITGYSAEEILGQNCRILQGPDNGQAALLQVRQALARREPVRSLLRNYRKDGSMFWNELTLAPVFDQGVLTHYVGLQRDVTADLASEEALRSSLQRESQALSFAGLGSLELHVRTAQLTLSERHARLLGLPGEQRTLRLAEMRALVLNEDRPIFDDGIKLCVAGHQGLDVEYRVQWCDGTVHWLHTQGNAEMDERGTALRLLALTQDVSARKDAEDQVRFIAHHDALTGLPNRALLRDRFQLAINGARRNRTRLALMFIDLDHFKDINDTLGHEVGDALLVSVAERMRGCLRDTDTVCRQSGDEFTVLLPNVRDANDAAHLADKLVAVLEKPHLVLGQELRVTCSAGVSLFPDDGETIDLLMRHADTAMYHAKGRGRNSVELFSREMNEVHQDRLTIANALRNAVARDELCLHYQPQFDVRTGALVGIEALVRWQHPERGLMHPDSFIGIAEESDLIVDIGDWVLREACAQARRWHEAGVAAVPIAVNLSPLQLRQRNIIEKVVSALHDSGLDSRWLELELTERALIHNAETAGGLLADLRNAGVRLALDDFGTGYSSLSYLHRFPVDKLKIDRSFVAASPRDASAAAIVHAMISLAHSMKLDVVAEGVETAEQLSFLAEAGCASFQGFLSGPVSAPADLLRHVGQYRQAAALAVH